MERLKISFPPSFLFSTQLPILITHINYGNHVGNDSFISLLHESRIRLLQHFGYTELDIEGLGLIMTDLQIQYKKQLHYADSVTIKLAIGNYTNKAFQLLYQMENNKTEQIVATACTTMLFYNYSTDKIANMPALFANKFGCNLSAQSS
jgi:acyl-CoA thioesterase FadM